MSLEKIVRTYMLLLLALNWSTTALAQTGAGECYFATDITRKNADRFLEIIRTGECRQMWLVSNGGDVHAAMMIGREVRKQRMAVVTRKPGCKSACVLIYAAGIERAPYGAIGIHRPYYMVGRSTFEQTSSNYRKLEAEVKAYLRSMNVSPALFDHMMRIAPEDMKDLTLDELESYGLGLDDPVHQEHARSSEARALGMSRAEYAVKMRATIERCGDIHRPADKDVMRNIVSCWKREWPEKASRFLE